MDFFTLYTLSTSAWLSLQAVPLLLTPSLIVVLLSDTNAAATDVEIYLSRALATALLASACMLLLHTGLLPVASSEEEGTSPYAQSTITVTTIFQGIAAILCYTNYTSSAYNFSSPSTSSSTGFALGATGNAILCAMGIWSLLFGGGSHISRRTGADKRVSGFMFPNEASDKKNRKTRKAK